MQDMGCYFFIPSGTKMLRVELQDIAMNAPMREGHQARVEGQMSRMATATNSLPAPWNLSEDFMDNNNQTDPLVLRRYFALAVKNLRRRVVRTGLTILALPWR